MQLAQAVLVPLLVDKDNVGPSGLKAITGMMTMRPTPDFDVSLSPAEQSDIAAHNPCCRRMLKCSIERTLAPHSIQMTLDVASRHMAELHVSGMCGLSV